MLEPLGTTSTCHRCGKEIPVAPWLVGKRTRIIHQECQSDENLLKFEQAYLQMLGEYDDPINYGRVVNWLRGTRQEIARRAHRCMGVETYTGKYGVEEYTHCQQPGKHYALRNNRDGYYCDLHRRPWMTPAEEEQG
jgi:hypothetical protein